MKTSAQIRESIGVELAKAEALNSLAEEREDKAHTADETAELEKIFGSGKKGEKDHKPGVLDRLESDLALAEKFEAKVAHYNAKRTETGVKPQSGNGDSQVTDETSDANRYAKVSIPAVARYHHANLKAFKGEYAEKQAYTTGMFLLATIGGSGQAKSWCKDHGIHTEVRGAMKESDNSLGGYLVPVEMERSIIALREERGVARRECQIYPMGSDTLTIPRRSGGITSYFVAELGSATASNPTLDQVSLSAKKLFGYTTMSTEVSEDAIISIADFITTELAYSFADKEDKCVFIGDSSNTYGGMTGIVNAVAAGSVFTATSHAEFSTLTLADFHGMTAKLPLYAQQNAKWYISKAGFSASMERLMAAGGGNTWQSLGAGQSKPMFLGYDVVFVQVMNSALTGNTGVTGGCYFGDVRQAVALGSRRGITLATSADFLFDSDQIAIRATERFDAVVHEVGTSTAAGSVVSLTFG